MSDERPLGELRAARRALQNEEDAVSFARRMTQGRLDLVLDEQRRRASGTPVTTSVTERLAEVFGQQHGGGSARPPRDTDVPADHPLLVQLDEICDEFGFADLEALPDRELADLAGALEMFEKSCSGRRHELFEQIDALTAELVGRLKSGGAGSLLAEG